MLTVATAVLIPATASAAPRLGSRTLREGMRGVDVLVLQRDLAQSGFEVRATGVYDAGTARAVVAFERRYGLAVDRGATPHFVRTLRTIHALDAATVGAETNGGGGLGAGGSSTGGSSHGTHRGGGSSKNGTTDGEGSGATQTPKLNVPKHVYGSRILHSGMTGTDVEMLQEYLTLAGYPTSVDGQFGPDTRQSVVAFQQAARDTINGVIGHPEAMALRDSVNKATVATGTSSGAQATLNSDGTVTPPAGAPQAVVNAITAANSIIDTPYIYGGGHGSFTSAGYDCSGAVSFALHGAGLLSVPEDSSQLETFGLAGPGRWMTIYSDPAHAFIVIAGIAFDTAHYGPTFPAGSGPRWLAPSDATANLSDGGDYVERHPAGL